MSFDVGIGGQYHADSLLFRALGLPFIKLFAEDIEASTMQFKLNMPVMLSAYANSQVYGKYPLQSSPVLPLPLMGNQRSMPWSPHPDSHEYRLQFWKQYEYNRWIGRPAW